MRILHVDGGRAWGGGQRQVWLLGEWQRQRGHQVTLAAPASGRLYQRASDAGWDVLGLGPVRLSNPITAVRLARACHGEDLVHSHTPGACALVGMLRRCSLAPHHVTSKRTAFPMCGVFRRSRSRWVTGAGLDGMIAISQAAAASMQASGGRPCRLSIIPSGVLLDCAPLPSPEGPPTVGYVGSLVRAKSVDTLIRSWPQVLRALSLAQLVIIGDGPEGQRLRDLADRLNIMDSVRFAGWQANPLDFLTGFDVLAHPAGTEALGNAVLEAMAMGVPVVASAVGGLSELLAAGVAGHLVTPSDPGALGEAIVDLLQNHGRSRRLAIEARLRIEESYGMERIGAAILGFYLGVLGTTSTKIPAAV